MKLAPVTKLDKRNKTTPKIARNSVSLMRYSDFAFLNKSGNREI